MTDYHNQIFNEDCRFGLDRIPDYSIDLVLMDPPYEQDTSGAGCFGSKKKHHFSEIEGISNGIDDELLDKIVSKLKAVNLYVWCNKNQIHQYLNYFADRGGERLLWIC